MVPNTIVLFNVLFVIFSGFCDKNYNGIIRQLLKLFLSKLETQIKRILNLNLQKKEDSIGFLLAIFETYIADEKIRQDKIDLESIKENLLDAEYVKSLRLENSLKGTSICELERISDPSVKSKHVVICITGFMQEDQNKKEFWEKLVEYYKHAEVYAVSWNACTPNSFLQYGAFSKKTNNRESKSFGRLLNFMNTAKR